MTNHNETWYLRILDAVDFGSRERRRVMVHEAEEKAGLVKKTIFKSL